MLAMLMLMGEAVAEVRPPPLPLGVIGGEGDIWG